MMCLSNLRGTKHWITTALHSAIMKDYDLHASIANRAAFESANTIRCELAAKKAGAVARRDERCVEATDIMLSRNTTLPERAQQRSARNRASHYCAQPRRLKSGRSN